MSFYWFRGACKFDRPKKGLRHKICIFYLKFSQKVPFWQWKAPDHDFGLNYFEHFEITILEKPTSLASSELSFHLLSKMVSTYHLRSWSFCRYCQQWIFSPLCSSDLSTIDYMAFFYRPISPSSFKKIFFRESVWFCKVVYKDQRFSALDSWDFRVQSKLHQKTNSAKIHVGI